MHISTCMCRYAVLTVVCSLVPLLVFDSKSGGGFPSAQSIHRSRRRPEIHSLLPTGIVVPTAVASLCLQSESIGNTRCLERSSPGTSYISRPFSETDDSHGYAVVVELQSGSLVVFPHSLFNDYFITL